MHQRLSCARCEVFVCRPGHDVECSLCGPDAILIATGGASRTPQHERDTVATLDAARPTHQPTYIVRLRGRLRTETEARRRTERENLRLRTEIARLQRDSTATISAAEGVRMPASAGVAGRAFAIGRVSMSNRPGAITQVRIPQRCVANRSRAAQGQPLTSRTFST
jgi:hypothetical protein